jgi:hypothetical protein
MMIVRGYISNSCHDVYCELSYNMGIYEQEKGISHRNIITDVFPFQSAPIADSCHGMKVQPGG